MTKTELIARVCEQSGMTRKEIATAIGTTIDEITRALVRGDNVRLTGFGTFKARSHTARNGRNPRTGAALKIGAHKSVAFSIGLELKKAINKKK